LSRMSVKAVASSQGAMMVKRLCPSASMPLRGSDFAAGFDLAASEASVVPAGGKGIVKTGLSIAIPQGTYARIAPRSGLAAKKMINIGAGVVDYDYRGEVGVVLFNHGTEDFGVEVGDRVAQLILENVTMVGCVEVDSLDETARGTGGYGSTGVSAKAALVPAGGKAIVKTGLSIAIPPCTYARIAPRSGLAAKKMLHVGAGVVDYDYRGEVGVVLFNHGPEDFPVAAGDRIAQLILEEISMAPCVEVETLEDTARGAGGFGSTGVTPALPNKRPREDAVETPSEVAEIAALKSKVEALTAELASTRGFRTELDELKKQVALLMTN
ncbi:unnamed protein product, partial [Polarella glacialis]